MQSKLHLTRQNSAISIEKKYFSSKSKNETETKHLQKSSKQVTNNKAKALMTISQEQIPKSQKNSLSRIPSLMNSRKISDKNYPINSADATRCYEENSQLIQQLIEENMLLQKQNKVKDTLITQLITNGVAQGPILERANTSNTERQYFKPIKKIIEKQEPALGFTFCNTNSQQKLQGKLPKSPNRLPKEFQATPNQNKFFV